MKLKLALIALPAAFAFASVSTNAQDTMPMCEQAAGQAFLGTTATQESGVAIMQATGATTLPTLNGFAEGGGLPILHPTRRPSTQNQRLTVIRTTRTILPSCPTG